MSFSFLTNFYIFKTLFNVFQFLWETDKRNDLNWIVFESISWAFFSNSPDFSWLWRSFREFRYIVFVSEIETNVPLKSESQFMRYVKDMTYILVYNISFQTNRKKKKKGDCHAKPASHHSVTQIRQNFSAIRILQYQTIVSPMWKMI